MSEINISKNAVNLSLLSDLKARAAKQFAKLEMPRFKYGLTVKLDLKDFNFKKLNIKTSEQKIVCPKGIQILNFEEAFERFPLILEELSNKLNSELNKFTAFHIANFTKTTVIIIPANYSFEQPFELETVFEDSSVENLFIIAEENSSATIIDKTSDKNSNSASLNSRFVEIFAADNSKINFLGLQDCSEKTVIFQKKHAVTENNSAVNWLDCNIGGATCISETTTNLKGAHSSTNNNNIFFGRKKQQFDINLKSIHEGEYTSSDMLTKGVLDDEAKAIYRGVLKIHTSANNASGYQKEDVTLLSNKAEADSIPELRINNNDVRKCTHGASVGQVDAGKLFYLMSRGFTKTNATKKLIEGFFASIFKKHGTEKFNETLQNLIEIKLETK